MRNLSAHRIKTRYVLIGLWFLFVAFTISLGSGIMASFVIVSMGIILLLLFVRGFVPAHEFRFLAILCICSFLLRAAVALVIHPFALFFGPDAGGYDREAWALAQEWRPGQFRLEMLYGGYESLVAKIYFVFGHTPVGAKIVNGLLGTLTAVFIYLIAREIFGRKVARTAFVLVAFFPSLVLWSALMLKDALAGFLLVLTIWSTLKLHRQFRIRYILVLLASIIYFMPIRYYLIPLIVAAVLSSFLIQSGRGLVRGVVTGAMVTLLFAAAWFYAPVSIKGRYEGYSVSLERMDAIRGGFAVGGSKFLGDVRIDSYKGTLKFLPVGLLYFFLGPFPWQVKAGRLLQVIAIPEVLMWYCLVPFMIYGFLYALKNTIKETYVIIIYTSILTLAYALAITNMGALYRFRAQMLIFYFIFVAIGIVRFRDRAAARSNMSSLAL